MEQKAHEALVRYHMLQKGDRLAIGVSGGADSVALFYFLCDLRDVLELKLTVCHVNHRLRGAESFRDEDFVRELAAKEGVAFKLLSVDAAVLAGEEKRGIEEVSRDVRYRFFRDVAGPMGKIVTAHTLDDSVETFLFHLVRGAGARGLRGIPPVRGNILRPFIGCTRQNIREYLHSRGLEWVEDTTNYEDVYTRNYIRHHLVPILKKINPAVTQALAGAMERLETLHDLAYEQVEEARTALRYPDGSWDATGLLALSPAVGNLLLLELLESAGVSPSSQKVGQMRRVLVQGGKISLKGNMVFYCRQGVAGFYHSRSLPCPIHQKLDLCYSSLPLEIFLSEGKKLKIVLMKKNLTENPEKINKRDLFFFADYAKIKNTVILRCKEDGDRIALPWRGRRLLKKLYQEAGISPEERKTMVVLCDEKGPFWAQGLGFDRRVVAEEGGEWLTIEVLEDVKDGNKNT